MPRLNALKGINTLLIDGNQMVRDSFKLAFDVSNVFLMSSSTGEDGLRKLKEMNFDVILFDLNLPDINGLEFYRKSKALNLDALYIMIPSWWNDSALKEAKRIGIHKIIEKPFSMNSLIEALIPLVRHQANMKVEFNQKFSKTALIDGFRNSTTIENPILKKGDQSIYAGRKISQTNNDFAN